MKPDAFRTARRIDLEDDSTLGDRIIRTLRHTEPAADAIVCNQSRQKVAGPSSITLHSVATLDGPMTRGAEHRRKWVGQGNAVEDAFLFQGLVTRSASSGKS